MTRRLPLKHRTQIHRPSVIATGLFLLALISGCASIDFDYPKTESSVLADTSKDALGVAFREVLDS